MNAELASHLNGAQAAKAIKQATEAIKQAEVCHTVTASTLQQAHRDGVLALEHQMKAEERQGCQAFVEAFGVAIQACPPENWGILLYLLQLLTGSMLVAALLGMLATTQLWAVADGELASAASIPSVSEMPALQAGGKCWCCSSAHGVPTLRLEEEETVECDDTPKEHPCQK